MCNCVETSLENLSQISMQIMKKCVDGGELTKADTIFLTMYQKEKAKAASVPTYRKIITGVKEVLTTIKEFLPTEEKTLPSESREVDTDEL